jgi:peroxiredoxin
VKRIILLLLSAFILFSCGQKSNFSISGHIDGGEGKTIYLNKLLTNSQLPLDSVKMDKKGTFKLKGIAKGPTFYLLKLSNTNFITLLLDSAETATVIGSYNNFAYDYDVEGSFNSKLVRDLNIRYTEVKGKMDSIKTLYTKNVNNPASSANLTIWNDEYTKLASNYTEYVTGFVKTNAFSPASIYALYQKWDDNNYIINDLQTMKTAASALSAMYPHNEHVKALYKNTIDIMRRESSNKTLQLLQENAVNSPNITLPDPDGIERSLWSLQGKYVLLHFWSAKDRTSRIQNEVLDELYAKYKSRGFEIYMVSIDDDKEAWKQAIAEDNLTWINVGDMKGSYQAVINYNIKAVPSNYLLDKEGKIIAKNLQGPALNQALSKYIK